MPLTKYNINFVLYNEQCDYVYEDSVDFIACSEEEALNKFYNFVGESITRIKIKSIENIK